MIVQGFNILKELLFVFDTLLHHRGYEVLHLLSQGSLENKFVSLDILDFKLKRIGCIIDGFYYHFIDNWLVHIVFRVIVIFIGLNILHG